MTKAKKQTIGSLIRLARENAGLTQLQAAELVNVERPNWARWEADGRIPRADMLFKIADALSVELDALRPSK